MVYLTVENDIKVNSLNHKNFMAMLYLPLWAATSTRAQDMLPALLSGLVYTIDL